MFFVARARARAHTPALLHTVYSIIKSVDSTIELIYRKTEGEKQNTFEILSVFTTSTQLNLYARDTNEKNIISIFLKFRRISRDEARLILSNLSGDRSKVLKLARFFFFRRVINSKLAHLFVLVGGHGDEFRLLENVTPERRVRKFQDVVGSYEVKPRLILVHRVQYRLQ